MSARWKPKLVRDKVTEILGREQAQYFARTARSRREFRTFLEDKFREEVGELISARDLDGRCEELADIIEVALAYAKLFGISPEELEAKRQKKKEVKGGFERRLILEFYKKAKKS